MKKEPNTVSHAEKKVLERKGEGSALKESERVMSTSELVFLRELKEKGVEAIQKNHLDVWFVSDYDKNWVGKHAYKVRLSDIEEAHNKEIEEQGDEESREYRFWHKDFRDMRHDLKEKYGNLEFIQEVPELIVIQAEKDDSDTAWTGAPKLIEDAVEQCLKNLYRYWEDEITLHLGEHLCCDIANKFEYHKIPLDQENLIEYGLMTLESVQRESQKRLFEQYILTKDVRYLQEFFSDAALKEIYEYMCTYDEDEADSLADYFQAADFSGGTELDEDSEFFQQFRGKIDHEKNRARWEQERERMKKDGEYVDEDDSYDEEWEEIEVARENYLEYRESIAEAARALSFDDIKETMRSRYVATVKRELDVYANEYIHEFDMLEAERKLLKPILVHVSENPVQRELMREHGADVVLEKFSPDDVQDLLDLVGKVKASAASLVPGKLRRIKSEFYESVQDKLDARSEITADTEKEVGILEEIFQRNGDVRKVLDVACGNGRISIPLLEKGYEVTGVDGNEAFLQRALAKAFEKKLSGATFKGGDVISYRDCVERASQDAVIYTWHSILEAFGPGNLLHSLSDAHLSLRPGGVLVFDQPTRDNPHMEDGWYGNDPDEQHHYLSYIMTEEEIRLVMKMAGFEDVEIIKWQTKPSDEYPDGMHKYTVSARKPDVGEEAKSNTRMFRSIIKQQEQLKQENIRYMKEAQEWMREQDEKRKSA